MDGTESTPSFKMRILLGSFLLAVGFAAPINFEETPVTTTPTKPLGRVEEIIEKSRYYMGAQDGAILEYFVKRFEIDPPSKEQYYSIRKWGKKWNLDIIKSLRYDAENNRIFSTEPDFEARDSQGNPVYQQAEPAKRPVLSDEEFNDRAIKLEGLLRHLLRQEGLSEQAVDEYFDAERLLLRPINLRKHFKLIDFCRKWGIERIESIQLFTDLIVTGAEEMPVPKTAATEEEQARIEGEARLRRKFHMLGLPEQAIDEFIVKGLFVRPITDDMRLTHMKWMHKWNHTNVLSEIKRIATNIYAAANMADELANDEEITQEKMQTLKDLFNNLPKYELDLLVKVQEHVEHEITSKHRYDVEQIKNGEPAETTPSQETTAEQFRGINDVEEMDKAGKIDFNNY